MKVYARFQKFGRFRLAHIDVLHPDGTYDLSYPYDRDPQGGIDKEQHIPRELQLQEEGGPPHLVIKPLSDHQRLVDFMNRYGLVCVCACHVYCSSI